MKRKVATRRTGEKSRKRITSTLQELPLRKSCIFDEKHETFHEKQAERQELLPASLEQYIRSSAFQPCAFVASEQFPGEVLTPVSIPPLPLLPGQLPR